MTDPILEWMRSQGLPDPGTPEVAEWVDEHIKIENYFEQYREYREEALKKIWLADLQTMRQQREEIASLSLRLKTLAQYAVHLGNCAFFEDGDVCTCGLAAFSELFEAL